MRCNVCYSSKPVRHLGSVFTVDIYGNIQSWCNHSYNVNRKWMNEQINLKLLRRVAQEEAELLLVKRAL